MFSYTLKKYTTPLFLVSLVLFLISALCLLLFVLSPTVADVINDTVAQAVRLALAKITSLLPFSLAELLICLSPVLVTLLIILYVRRVHTRSGARRFFLNILAVILLVASLYVFTIGAGYHTTRLDDKMGLVREKIEKEELLAVAEHLHEALLSDLDEITFAENGASQMPYTIQELSQRASEAYDAFATEHPSLLSYNYHSRIKGVYFSRAMSYAHILGIYTFFTGEANVNVDYPDAEIPTTALHEMAHQRGISREDEASFVAFIIGRGSDDAYTRYSANFDLFRYVLNALWRADHELYREFFSRMDSRIVGDIRAISNHAKQFENNPVGNISSSLNDAYLKANGTEGAVSYGFIVDLAVAFYKENYPSLFS
ncbi:MAG: DUF3810 domain-containing protein [Clostridia bacterium]|nr:DUF3810 domain-containing protein [Clostridia bacterium]